MVVKGCYHGAYSQPTAYVWEFVPGCSVRNCEDRFNHSDKVTVVSGADLRTQWSNDGSALALKAPSVRFTAEKVGFFGATPVARERYFIPAYVNRTLVHGNEVPVLATLIRDLAALGLLRCDVRGSPPLPKPPSAVLVDRPTLLPSRALPASPPPAPP